MSSYNSNNQRTRSNQQNSGNNDQNSNSRMEFNTGNLPTINPTMANQIDDLFSKADASMFRERNYTESERLYRKILEIDSNSVEAYNSLANCLKLASINLP